MLWLAWGMRVFLVLILLAGLAAAGIYFYVQWGARRYAAANARHGGIEFRENGLIGRFYAAPGARHRTSVLMLGGSNGGFPYDKAAQDLAKAGYPVLALAYFRDFGGNPPDAPKYLANIPLEYFFIALDWMKMRPEVDPNKIVLMGESRGGELVLLLGSLRSGVAGVIAYSPSAHVWGGLGPGYKQPAWLLGAKPLPGLYSKYKFGEPVLDMFKRTLKEASPAQLAAAAIPVEKIHGPVLLISSKADKLWPSAAMADAAEARMKANHFAYPITNLQFDDASHLLMGYGPGLIKFGIPMIWEMNFGGSPEGTRKARDAGWVASKAFLAQIESGAN